MRSCRCCQHGKARAAHIAAEFGMSQRTFARRLADEDLTFSQLLDRLRLDLARRYLLNDGIADIQGRVVVGLQGSGRVLARVPPLDWKISQPGRATGTVKEHCP